MKHVFHLRSNTYIIFWWDVFLIKKTHWNNATCIAIPEKTCHTVVISYYFILKTCKKLGLLASSRVPNTSAKQSPSFLTYYVKPKVALICCLVDSQGKRETMRGPYSLPGWSRPGGDSHMKGARMLIVSLTGVNVGFWSHLGRSG